MNYLCGANSVTESNVTKVFEKNQAAETESSGRTWRLLFGCILVTTGGCACSLPLVTWLANSFFQAQISASALSMIGPGLGACNCASVGGLCVLSLCSEKEDEIISTYQQSCEKSDSLEKSLDELETTNLQLAKEIEEMKQKYGLLLATTQELARDVTENDGLISQNRASYGPFGVVGNVFWKGASWIGSLGYEG